MPTKRDRNGEHACHNRLLQMCPLVLEMTILSLFTKSNIGTINCHLFNAQSIVNKLTELQYVLYNTNCDCLFITETWLSSYISDGQIDPQNKQCIIRKDRPHGKGGGVCAIVHKRISILPLDISSKYDDLEVIGFDLIGVAPVIRVIVMYRPPYYDTNAKILVRKWIDFFTEYITSCGKY